MFGIRCTTSWRASRSDDDNAKCVLKRLWAGDVQSRRVTMDVMRIFWQSFVSTAQNEPYLRKLSSYLNEIAATGTTVHVDGLPPHARNFGRLAELRSSILAINNGLAAEDDGFDAYVMGHFQDPGLYELRSTLRIPAIGAGEATLLAASQLGRRLGLVTLDPAFEVWHLEQAERYGLNGRIVKVAGLGCKASDFADAFAGDQAAKARMLRDFIACAEPLVDAGADVIIPAGVLPGLLVCEEHNFKIGHAPVVNCAAVALKTAEMWVQLRHLSGLEPSRGPSFALASPEVREGFRAFIAGATSSR